MIKAPEIPKVRAHLFARLCLAATEHAAKAAALLRSAKIDDELVQYVEDLRRVGKAKACRFFGIDAELGGQMGTGIAWLRAGMQELGIATAKAEDGKRGLGLGLGRLKKEWNEKREDRKVDKGTAWGADAGVAEEGRVLAMLEAKWVKMNDTVSLPSHYISSLEMLSSTHRSSISPVVSQQPIPTNTLPIRKTIDQHPAHPAPPPAPRLHALRPRHARHPALPPAPPQRLGHAGHARPALDPPPWRLSTSRLWPVAVSCP
jgi:hypothetical protein